MLSRHKTGFYPPHHHKVSISPGRPLTASSSHRGLNSHFLLQSGSPGQEDRLQTPGTCTCNPRYFPPWSCLLSPSFLPSSMTSCLAAVAMGTIFWLQGQGLLSHPAAQVQGSWLRVGRQLLPVGDCWQPGVSACAPTVLFLRCLPF